MLPPITLERYLTEEFFTLIGMQDLPLEEKERLAEEINQTVVATVYATVYEELSEEEKVQVDGMASDDLLTFFADRGFNIPELVVKEALRYRLELAKLFEAMVNAASKPTVPQPQAA